MNFILGSGGHAKLIKAYLGNIQIEHVDKVDEKSFFQNLCSDDTVYLGIGDNSIRLSLGSELIEKKCKIGNIFGPSSHVDKLAYVEFGVFVGAGAMILPTAKISKFSIINTMTSVDHDCIVGEGSQIAAGVNLAGGTVIGRNCFLGMGVVTLPGVEIGENSQIMAGTVVSKNVPPNVIWGGNPGRLVKKIEES